MRGIWARGQIGALAFAALLGGCAVTEPVAVIDQAGESMKGTTTASLAGGTFTASNEKTTCNGTYDSMTPTPVVSFAVICTDGRKGIGRAVRDSDISGSGTIAMSDGTTAKFVFGPSAANF